MKFLIIDGFTPPTNITRDEANAAISVDASFFDNSTFSVFACFTKYFIKPLILVE